MAYLDSPQTRAVGEISFRYTGLLLSRLPGTQMLATVEGRSELYPSLLSR